MDITWKLILVGLAGIILGALANYLTNRISNEQLKKDLIAELIPLINKQKTARLIDEEQKRIVELQAQLNVLNKKIK